MSRIRADRYTNREGTGAPTFSDGVNVVGVTSMSGNLAVTNGTITGASELSISGISSSIVGVTTVTDVFVYDTSKDSDGGAWRKRTQNTSWYNETLNTATRGSRKEFPAVAVIVGEINKVTIYDGDDPDLPMWMIFNKPSNGYTDAIAFGKNLRAIYQLNGKLAVATSDGQALIDFISEDCRTLRANTQTNKNAAMYGGIVNRNGNMVPNTNAFDSAYNIGDSSSCNDVVMTLLPNAPIDDATGLPVPTIAVATAGGVSVIKDDGNVGNITFSSYVTIGVSFDKNNGLWVGYLEGTTAIGWYYYTSFETTSSLPATGPNCNSGWSGSFNMIGSSNFTGLGYNYSDFTAGTVDRLHNFNGFGIVGAPTKLVNYISTTYNTGWVPGDIKLATLSDTNATSQTGGTVADRSVNNNSVNVVGTVTRTAVATGADLVAYSGFSNSNYLQQPVNSDMQTGTGGFSVTAWFKTTSTATEYEGLIYYNRPGSIGEGFQIMMNNSNKGLYWYVYGPTNDSATTNITGLNDGVWHQIVATHIDGSQQLFIDGVLKNTQSIVTGSINDAQAQLHIGRWYGNANVSDYWWRGSVTLVRHSASIPSAEQVKKMYEDEKVLFQENSQATLYGSSDSVTALGYDDTTNILHVGTSDGRSDFQGLRRINNTTVGITTAISASNELVAEQ